MRLAALYSLLLTSPALAMRQAMPPAELCAQTPLVVEAEVTGQQGMWDGPLIETHIDLHIHQVFKGPLDEDSLSIVIPGGTANGVTLSVSEAASLKNDHRYVLLLIPRPDGAWTLSGGPDGAFALTGKNAVPLSILSKRLENCHVR